MADGGAARGARILYITGSGRSGTNFLGQLLGQADRFCFVGEAMYGGPSLATRRCGCGVPLPDCEFWRGIRRDAGDGRLLDEQRFFGLGRLARWRHLPLTLAPDRNRRLAALYGQDWQGCATLYATIAAVTGAEVIVDTSKSVPYARMLNLVPELDVRVVPPSLSRGRCVLPQELYCAVRADDLGDLDASAQAAGPHATPRLLCAAGACRVAILVIRLTRRVRAGPLSSP